MENHSLMSKLLFFSLYLGFIVSCNSQTKNDNQTDNTLIDSTSKGRLFLVNGDSIMFKDNNGNVIYKDFEKGVVISKMKLKEDTLFLLAPSSVLTYNFYSGKTDTILYNSKIEYYSNLDIIDNFLVTNGENILIYDLKKSQIIYEADGFLNQNFLLKDTVFYILHSKEYENVDLIEFNTRKEESKVLYNFKEKNISYNAHKNPQLWKGMFFIQNNLFLQFYDKMIVFDLDKNKIITVNESLSGETKLLNQNKSVVIFESENRDKYKYILGLNKFEKI